MLHMGLHKSLELVFGNQVREVSRLPRPDDNSEFIGRHAVATLGSNSVVVLVYQLAVGNCLLSPHPHLSGVVKGVTQI